LILWSFLVMQGADLVSFLFMSSAGEFNPLVAANPEIAVWAKAYLVAFVVSLWYYRNPFANRVLWFGALVGAIGLGSNLAVILGGLR